MHPGLERSLVRALSVGFALSFVAARGCVLDGDVSLGDNGHGGRPVARAGSGGAGLGGSGGEAEGGRDTSGGAGVAATNGGKGGRGGTGAGGTGASGAGRSGTAAGTGGTAAPVAGEGGTAAGGAGRGGEPAGGTTSGGAGGSGATGAEGGAAGQAPLEQDVHLGCRYVGGIDRVVIARRDAASDRCVGLVLRDGGSNDMPGLVLPTNWSVEALVVGPADECPSRVATRVQGNVTGIVTAVGDPLLAVPDSVSAHVELAFAPDQGLPATIDLEADGVDVRAACNQACAGSDPQCNDDPALSSLHGRCTAAGTCVCGGGFELNTATGRCL